MLDMQRLRVLSAVAKTGSVTAAARHLHYAQPSISHHLARLEAETGAKLVQRVGRGIRLTAAGKLLAGRAEEILGRLETARLELAAHVGLSAGTVRLVASASGLLELLPPVVERLAAEHPGLELHLADTHPPERLQMLRTGEADIALLAQADDTPPCDGIRLTYLRSDAMCLITPAGVGGTLVEHRDAPWIGGCEHVRASLIELCATAGFAPRITCSTDDIATKQALVASGLGVAVLPRLALASHRHPGVEVTEIPGAAQRIHAATYGEPPDPPPTAAVLAALVAESAERAGIR